MELTHAQGKRIAANIRKVFETEDVTHLQRGAYTLITLHMGFIAHYDLHGFQGTYKNPARFARMLQTSEHSDDPAYNSRWADELDRRFRDDPVRGCGQSPAVTEAIRAIVLLAQGYERRKQAAALNTAVQQYDALLATMR